MAPRPHVVWVTLDSVRADHTTMGGYERETTPAVGDLAAGSEGQWFGRCFAHGKYTLTSTTSMLTGTYPTSNRVGYDRSRLPADVETVPERFADAGYRTGGFSSNRYVSGETGLDRGFDRFAWIHPSTLRETVRLRDVVAYARNIRRHSAGLQLDAYKHATPFLLDRTIRDWFRRNHDAAPLYLYAHFNEPHRPYYPPLPYLDEYTDATSMTPAKAGEFSMAVHETLEQRLATGAELSADELAALEAMYDAEIRYTDRMVGDLLEWIRTAAERPVVVVVTADHGELFGEYGLLGHKFVLKDELTNVPLVTNGLDLEGIDPGGLVQHADLLRTILSDVGASVDGIEGVDLRETERSAVVSQDHETDLAPYREHNPEFTLDGFHVPDVSAIRTDEFRYQQSADGAELFSLPDETTDVSEQFPEVRASLRSELETWLESHDREPVDAAADYSEEMRSHLADLGYM